MKRKLASLAKLISRVFDPVWEIPIAIGLAVLFAIQEGLRWRFLGLLLFVDAIVPCVFFLIMLWHRQIKSWDMRDRRERVPLYFFTMLCHLGGIWLAREIGKVELAQILTVFWILGLIFSVVTYFWKISIHAGVNSVLVIFVNMMTDWKYWYLLGIIPLVGWARVYGKHHHWGQFAAGTVLGGGVCYYALKVAGI